jgi:hypothetical protein
MDLDEVLLRLSRSGCVNQNWPRSSLLIWPHPPV